jgi:hypothetical protein
MDHGVSAAFLVGPCGVPDGTVLNRIVRVREKLYACCSVFEGEETPQHHTKTGFQ